MSVFKDALRKGLADNAKLNDAKQDVDRVLGRASAEASALVNFPMAITRTRENLVEAHWIDVHRRILGEVNFAPCGYPAQLTWFGDSMEIADQSGVEAAVVAMLASASTGALMMELITSYQAERRR